MLGRSNPNKMLMRGRKIANLPQKPVGKVAKGTGIRDLSMNEEMVSGMSDATQSSGIHPSAQKAASRMLKEGKAPEWMSPYWKEEVKNRGRKATKAYVKSLSGNLVGDVQRHLSPLVRSGVWNQLSPAGRQRLMQLEFNILYNPKLKEKSIAEKNKLLKGARHLRDEERYLEELEKMK